MATISGIVTEVRARNTSFGDMYDVHINGRAYGHGKFPPRGVKAGDFVTLEYTEKQNGQYTNYNIVPRTLRVEANQSPQQTQQVAPASSGPVRVPVVDKRQETISKQSAMNTALTLLGLKLQYGAIKVPAKAQDAFTLIDTLLADTAARVYEVNTGETWNITAADLSKPAEKAKSATDEPPFLEDEINF